MATGTVRACLLPLASLWTLGQGAQFVFCVCEEIMGTVANKVGAADLGVGDRKLWRALAWSEPAHELFLKKSQYG